MCLTRPDGKAVVTVAGLALGHTVPRAAPWVRPKKITMRWNPERVCSVGPLGAKTEMPVTTRINRDGGSLLTYAGQKMAWLTAA